MKPAGPALAAALLCRLLCAETVPVPVAEQGAWCSVLLPLPQELAIPAKAIMKPGDLALRGRPGAGAIETQALTELQELFKEKAGAIPAGRDFDIVIGVVDANGQLDGVPIQQAARLRQAPYPEQAYTIEAQGENRLLVAAVAEPGVYYGAQTLRQLLEPRLTAARLEIPLAAIVDWPALDERGLWNNDLALIPWMATLKLNFVVDPLDYARLERGKPVTTTLRVRGLEQALPRAMHFLPHLPHDNFLHRYGMDEAYPELVGKGERSKCPYKFASEGHRAPCASNPLLAQITAAAMRDVASKGAREVSVWGSEHASQCECEACLRLGQFRNETQAGVDGWLEARKTYPELGLRLFYCMGSTSSEDTLACLLALPPEVKIERCYGAFGEAFTAAARQGRWLADYSAGVTFYPQTAWLRFWGSWVRADLRNQVARGYRAKYVITHSQAGTAEAHDYNLSALAEYGWNLDGRELPDFALAWATRQGCAKPQIVADWITRLDPIESDLARGALSLYSRDWDVLPEQLLSRKPFAAGSSAVFIGFPTLDSISERLAACQAALPLAEATGRPDLVLESRYVTALLQALQALRTLLDAAPTADLGSAAGRDAVKAAAAPFGQAVESLASVTGERTHLSEADRTTHAALWRKRAAALEAAVAKLTAPAAAP